MKKDSIVELEKTTYSDDPLTEVLRKGSRELLAQAIEIEVEEFLKRYRDIQDEDGRRMIVRNGYLPKRDVQTGIGSVRVRCPRVRDRRSMDAGERIHFTSSILPPYHRRTKSLEELIPWLYLKGVSTGDFSEALAALVGKDAPGLGSSTIARFWKAFGKVYGQGRWQRCWVHKTANVLNKFPKSMQKKAKERLHQVWMAEGKEAAHRAFDHFIETYEAKYPKATECLKKDREELLSFYDFPAEHWAHIRTTNPIESTFATVKLRTAKTRGCVSRDTALTMVFQLCRSAERKWRRLNSPNRCMEVIDGVKFVNGVNQQRKAA